MSLRPWLQSVTANAAGLTPQADAVQLGRFVSERDESAFAAMVGRHGATVLGVCRRMLRDHHDAEDATQAVFVVLARHAGSIRRPENLAAWLHGVAVRVCRKALARRAKRPALEPAPEPAVEPTLQDGMRAIDEALLALPEKLRQPLVLCYLHGLTRDEAAAELGLSATTFRGRLDRGKERFQKELRRRGFPLAIGFVGTVLTTSPLPAATARSIRQHALGSEPLPDAMKSLTHGVTSVMPKLKFWSLAALAAGLLIVGWIAVSASWRQPPAGGVRSDAFTKLSEPDPKAGKAPPKLEGTWTAAIVSADGKSRREFRVKFLDDRHTRWDISVTSPSLTVPATISVRMKYEFTPQGELKEEMLEKWSGEDIVPLTEDDKKPRVWKYTPNADGNGFTLVNPLTTNSLSFTRAGEQAKAPADPLVAEKLVKIDRAITKLPTLESEKPGYCLLAFGPEAEHRVWVILDGSKLYVDRNGDGDLTDDGAITADPALSVPSKSYVFSVTDIGPAKQEKKFALLVSTLTVGPSQPAAILIVTRDGHPTQKVGPEDLRFTDKPEDARVLHFSSPVITIRPSIILPTTLDAEKASEFRVQVGTPGVGAGSFVSFFYRDLAKNRNPIAEFTFQPARAGDEPIVKRVTLDERCCDDHFSGTIEVPKGTIGDRVHVSVQFPDCSFGPVSPFVGDVRINRTK
ncbi:RNA polymerase sigma factor [Frigoriglobus tundricola]|uniref:ECF RNA polymerase sigma factor SigE n=1 Tax=Frigoriglobus tundricola TaxID=2774151 RepID=A0A6M5Z0F9_9BACT|nr:RNA polymerase sigma factor [Frigoriglobus tundricola]QJW98943.1 hypothetical protein FTUN_6538 [Frigoriglobus tundricola]